MACPPKHKRKGLCVCSGGLPPSLADYEDFDKPEDEDTMPNSTAPSAGLAFTKGLLINLMWVIALVAALTVAYQSGVHVERAKSAQASVSHAADSSPEPVVVLVDERSGACLTMLHKTRTYACSQEVPGLLTYQPVTAHER